LADFGIVVIAYVVLAAGNDWESWAYWSGARGFTAQGNQTFPNVPVGIRDLAVGWVTCCLFMSTFSAFG